MAESVTGGRKFGMRLNVFSDSAWKEGSIAHSSKGITLPADNAGRCITDLPHPLINMQMTLIDMQIT